MTTRSAKFFMRPDEFSTLIDEVTRDLHLSVVSWRERAHVLEFARAPDWAVMSDGRVADRLFLASSQPDLAAIDSSDLRPGENGWVDCDVPRVEGNILFISQAAAKTDWFDAREARVRESNESVTLFQKFKPYLRRRLNYPVFAYNLRGGQAVMYRDIGYSEGAARWVEEGGELGQEGVLNVRFLLREPGQPNHE
jgi:hypothetical protein